MRIFGQLALASAITLGFAVPATADEFVHEANIMARLGNHPNVVHFIGAVTVDVGFEDTPIGDNPLYEADTVLVDNPLYSVNGEPGTPGAIQSITFELDSTGLNPSLHSEGVIHRDIAARNILVTTNQGTYTAGPSEFLLFGNDGPPTLQGNGNVGPIRWMAPESLRLHRTGSTDPNDWIEIAGGAAYFDVNYVPEPSSLALLALGVSAGLHRRRTT